MFGRFRFLLLLATALATSCALWAQGQPLWLADLLDDRPALTDPTERAETVRLMQRIEVERKAAAVARAQREGRPLRMETAEGQVAEIMDYDGDSPLYAVTYNQEAAITTAADLTRSTFGVDGSNTVVGVWDGGGVRPTHQAFQGRVSVRDGSATNSHATHIGGTIAAGGTNLRARGMAPAALIDSYDWNSDKSEMTTRGASFPNEADKLLLSNHSYGYRSGWELTSSWEWFGRGTNETAVEEHFGRYNNYSRDMDSLAYSLPYYLAIWAAGNDRNNNPSQGSTVIIGGNTVTYNSAIHPPGDGIYKDGYDTIGFESLSKNVLTIGAVNDAVTSGQRDLKMATMAGFSSWGPTDDGRIKPDLVASGVSVYSTTSSTDTAYGISSGTSMATANATGSAQLLVAYFARLFPNHAMRASTLKALLIHTADNLGEHPGPNYRFGWGLINTEAAARHIAAHRASPGSHHLIEGQLTTASSSHSYSFTWDGISPIRATLAWTDPAGGATTTHDNRLPRLVNNLDLAIEGPGGSIHLPYVMPYVGSWQRNLLSTPATTGKNNTDNVEQVFLSAPAPGIYTARVTFSGTLTHSQQFYSLLISGSAPTTAPAPVLTGFSLSASGDMTLITVDGSGFQQGVQVSLELQDQSPRLAYSHESTPQRIRARVDTAKLAGGTWAIVVTNTDGQRAVLPNALPIASPLWMENFETGAPGWSSAASVGSSHWALTTLLSRSPSRSFHALAPATRNLDALYSPALQIPADSEELTLSFWHAYDFQNGRDGGVLEFSLNNGSTWFDVTASGSGASFLAGGYTTTLSGTGQPATRNPLDGRRAWSGNKMGFSEVVVKLEAGIYAGKNLRVRWQLGTDSSTSTTGWYLDDVSLRGASAAPLSVPELVTPAYASETTVTGTSVDLSVEVRNSDGTDDLTYTWTVNESRDFPVAFSINGTQSANSTTAFFSSAGDYLFEVTARNSGNQTTSSTVGVSVLPTETAVSVEPSAVTIPASTDYQFAAEALDQFENPLEVQPPFLWQVAAEAGSISPSGLLTASGTGGGPFLLTATTPSGKFGAASVTVEAPVGFASWLQQNFSAEERNDDSVSGEGADPDGDGLPNLLEYALGSDPRQASRERVPAMWIEGDEQQANLVLTFSRPLPRPDVQYLVEYSHDLGEWDPVPVDHWQIEPNGDEETVRITLPLTGDDNRRFLRLSISR
jgi:hypothetical protein